MKKLTAVAMAVAFAVPAMAYAEGEAASSPKVSIALWGGYMTVAAGDINDSLDDGAKTTRDNGATPVETTMSGGFQGGLEGTYAVIPNLGVGLRACYLLPGNGTLNVKEIEKDVYDVSAAGIPILLGGRYMVPMNDKVSVGGALFLGAGITSGTMRIYDPINDKTSAVDFDGTAFAGEVMVGVSYKITPQVALGLDLGYRMLNAPMAYSKDDADSDIKAGDKVKNDDDEAMNLDLSGLIVAVSVGSQF